MFVTECCSDVIHIICGDAGCVELQIGFRFELCAALANGVERKEVTKIALQIGRIEQVAIEWIRAAGAALVHKHEIAMFTPRGKRLRNVGSVFGGGRSWPTGEIDNRVGLAFIAGCRQDDDIQIRRDLVVLPAGDGAAIAFPFDDSRDMHLTFACELLRRSPSPRSS